MKRGVIGLGTLTPNLCVWVNDTSSLAAPKVARPLPKYHAPLSMEVIMNLAPLFTLKQSHWSNRYESNREVGRGAINMYTRKQT